MEDTMNSTPATAYYDLQEEYCREAACITEVIFHAIVFILGIAGNGAVIWITGFKMKKSVNTTWYLSLALSDFIFCSTLPLTIDYILKKSWNFGLFMCKFITFIIPLSMYSSIFILVIITLYRCITVKFPVWAQNQRTVKKASTVVVLAWIVSSLFSIPPAKFSKIINIGTKDYCYSDNVNHHKIVVFMRFTFGFLLPFLTLFVCYSILIRNLMANQTSKFIKPFKITTLLIAAFFICRLPIQIGYILVLYSSEYSFALHVALQVSVTLACANRCLNPFIYAFMGKDLNKKWYYFLSKIERAIDEETQSAVGETSNTNSMDNPLLSEILTQATD